MRKEPRSMLEQNTASDNITPIASIEDQGLRTDAALDQLAEILVDQVIYLNEQGVNPKNLIQYFERQQWQPPAGKAVADSSEKKGTA